MQMSADVVELSPFDAVISDDIEAIVRSLNQTPEWKEINLMERAAAQMNQVHCPLRHVFTPGLYTREITMPADALIFSRIHKFEHPFNISQGVVSVWSKETGWITLRAPYLGITTPGKRRVLYIHEKTIWTTSHVTNLTDPDKIVDAVTFDHMKLGHMDDLTPGEIARIDSNAKPAREIA